MDMKQGPGAELSVLRGKRLPLERGLRVSERDTGVS
jgi:hypothetical protein